MYVSISCINTNNIIVPGNQFRTELKANHFAYYEIQNELELRRRNESLKLLKGSVVFGRQFKLLNRSTNFACIKGVIFKCDWIPSSMDVFWLGAEQIETTLFRSKSNLFDNSYSIDIQYGQLEQLLPSYLQELLNKTSQYGERRDQIRGKIDTRLIRVNRYIRENYHRPITLQMLAELIHCNPIYLSNTYSKVFNISPLKYLQNIRMEKAQSLLVETGLSIKEIANHLGYISNSQFTDLFKRYFNYTPSEYRIMKHLSNS